MINAKHAAYLGTSSTDLSLGASHHKHIEMNDARITLNKDTYIGADKVLTSKDLGALAANSASVAAPEGSVVVAGSGLVKQQSPAPIVVFDAQARLNSFNLYNNIFQPNIMGYFDAAKSNTYAHGLAPPGSASHGSQFLRKDGQWAQMSPYVGSVADTFLSLQDTPAAHSQNKYIKCVSGAQHPSGFGLEYTDELNDVASVTCSGPIRAQQFISLSDRRFKHDIEEVPDALKKVESLHPMQYKFNGDKSERTQIGLIAQEVKSSSKMPEIVVEEEDHLMVDYQSVISCLVGAVKTLSTELSELKTQLTTTKTNVIHPIIINDGYCSTTTTTPPIHE